MEIDRSRFLDWNIPINQDPSLGLGRKRAREDRDDPDYRSGPIRKHPTQLIRLLSMVTSQPWQPQVIDELNPGNHLVDLVDINISDQSEEGYNGAGIFIANSDFSKQNSLAWNLGKECEVYDAEIFAIYKALEIGNKRGEIENLDIWVFSDNQAALKGLAWGQNRGKRALFFFFFFF